MLTGVFAYDPSEITLSLGGWQPYGFALATTILVPSAKPYGCHPPKDKVNGSRMALLKALRL